MDDGVLSFSDIKKLSYGQLVNSKDLQKRVNFTIQNSKSELPPLKISFSDETVIIKEYFSLKSNLYAYFLNKNLPEEFYKSLEGISASDETVCRMRLRTGFAEIYHLKEKQFVKTKYLNSLSREEMLNVRYAIRTLYGHTSR